MAVCGRTPPAGPVACPYLDDVPTVRKPAPPQGGCGNGLARPARNRAAVDEHRPAREARGVLHGGRDAHGQRSHEAGRALGQRDLGRVDIHPHAPCGAHWLRLQDAPLGPVRVAQPVPLAQPLRVALRDAHAQPHAHQVAQQEAQARSVTSTRRGAAAVISKQAQLQARRAGVTSSMQEAASIIYARGSEHYTHMKDVHHRKRCTQGQMQSKSANRPGKRKQASYLTTIHTCELKASDRATSERASDQASKQASKR